MKDKAEYGPVILRIVLGLLFLIPGLGKLMNPAGITGMLGNIGFPVAILFAWILILSEIVFGIALLIGWRVKYTVWPLVIVLAVAGLFVALPSLDMSNPGTIINLLWHLVGIGGLITLSLIGPGKYAIDKM